MHLSCRKYCNDRKAWNLRLHGSRNVRMKGIYEKVDVFRFAMCAFAILAKQKPFAALAKQASFGMGVMIANEFDIYLDLVN
jgi:hypothetical protein